MFNLSNTFNNIDFNVSLKDKVCVFCDLSGTGKTFLFKTIQSYCLESSKSCIYLDYNMWDTNKDKIVGLCVGREVVILDNADLYLDNDMLNEIENSADLVLVCLKKISTLDMKKSRGIYTVDYKSNSLTTKKRG